MNPALPSSSYSQPLWSRPAWTSSLSLCSQSAYSYPGSRRSCCLPWHISAQVTGVDPVNDIAILQLVGTGSPIGEVSIHLIHPARQIPTGEFVEIIDSLNEGRAVDIGVRPLVIHLDLLVAADSLEDIKGRVPLAQHAGSLRQDNPVGGHIFLLPQLLIQLLPILFLQKGVTANADGHCLIVLADVLCMSQVILLYGLNPGALHKHQDQYSDDRYQKYILLHGLFPPLSFFTPM